MTRNEQKVLQLLGVNDIRNQSYRQGLILDLILIAAYSVTLLELPTSSTQAATEGQDATSIGTKLFLLLGLELKVKTKTQDDRSISDLSLLWTKYNSVVRIFRDECELFSFPVHIRHGETKTRPISVVRNPLMYVRTRKSNDSRRHTPSPEVGEK